MGVNGKFFKWFKVMSGIPQGSILGPILFLIYINDLPESCDIIGCDANIYLYADDAKLYKVIKNLEDNIVLQIEIEPEQFLVLFRPRTTSVRSGLGTFFVLSETVATVSLSATPHVTAHCQLVSV